MTIHSSNTNRGKTRILYGEENTSNAILGLVSTSNAGIDIYGNYKMLPMVIRDELFTKALSDAKSRGVRLRNIIEITKENTAYCKELISCSTSCRDEIKVVQLLATIVNTVVFNVVSWGLNKYTANKGLQRCHF